jgi:hypothetical protein
MPILMETCFILKIWLKDYPYYTIIFTQLIIVDALIESISNPLMTIAQATGKIKKYLMVIGGIRIMNLPIAYLLLKIGYSYDIILYAEIFVTLACTIARWLILKELVNFNLKLYIKNVLMIVSVVAILSFAFPMFIKYFFLSEGWIRFFTIAIACELSLLIVVYFIGISKKEKYYLRQFIQNKIKNNFYNKK